MDDDTIWQMVLVFTTVLGARHYEQLILPLEDHGEIWQRIKIIFKSLKTAKRRRESSDRGNDGTKTEVSGMFPNINNDHVELQQKILFNWCSHFAIERYLLQRVTVKVKRKYT